MQINNDRYWNDPKTDNKNKRNELISLITKEKQIIESCNCLIKHYQDELKSLDKEDEI